MTIDLAALEALLANATPVPWLWLIPRADQYCDYGLNQSEVLLVLAAVNALPELIARMRELERERDRYHDALLSRHGGEPLALLDELDTARAEIRTAALAMRERCAQACESEVVCYASAGDSDYNRAVAHCAAAIRALEV